jgi:hypothetical protein
MYRATRLGRYAGSNMQPYAWPLNFPETPIIEPIVM